MCEIELNLRCGRSKYSGLVCGREDSESEGEQGCEDDDKPNADEHTLYEEQNKDRGCRKS